MSIQELSRKFKGLYSNPEYLLLILIITVSFVSFYLGRVSVGNGHSEATRIPIQATIIESNTLQNHDITSTTTPLVEEKVVKETYVASKSGTKYHLPWCPGAKQIKDENKVWFATKTDAEKAGYTPAANCKGI
ncbi:hypothetical protein IPH92_00995 [Candidatus Kaiserbacteria bacterium]|nr:MAG: hypothetical protein IPH92_00995 [Candidatus Kaiserbacteria bacterium]